MAWQLLAAAAPYVIKGVGQALGIGRPEKEDYMPDTSYMDKYITNLKTRMQGSEVQHMAMQPMLRTIGQQGRRQISQIEQQSARTGMTGSGIEAQQRLSAQQNVITGIQQAGEKATALQMAENRRMGTEADRAVMEKERMIAGGEKAFEQAEKGYKQGIQQNILEGVGAVAGTGIQMGMETSAAQKSGYQEALAGGTLPKVDGKTMSYDDYKQGISDLSTQTGLRITPETYNAITTAKQSENWAKGILGDQFEQLKAGGLDPAKIVSIADQTFTNQMAGISAGLQSGALDPNTLEQTLNKGLGGFGGAQTGGGQVGGGQTGGAQVGGGQVGGVQAGGGSLPSAGAYTGDVGALSLDTLTRDMWYGMTEPQLTEFTQRMRAEGKYAEYQNLTGNW